MFSLSSRLLGKDLGGLSLKELQHLEQQVNEGLSSVNERKVCRCFCFLLSTKIYHYEYQIGFNLFRQFKRPYQLFLPFQEQLLMEQLEQSRMQVFGSHPKLKNLTNQTEKYQAQLLILHTQDNDCFESFDQKKQKK